MVQSKLMEVKAMNIRISQGQEFAVKSSTESPLQIVACPGSGKTFSLIARVKWILNTCNFKHNSKILILSFSRNTVAELHQRLNSEANFSHHRNRVEVATFHSVCYRILKEKSSFLQLFTESPIVMSSKIAASILMVNLLNFVIIKDQLL